MTQEVDVPGVGRLQFPDGMSHQDMANAIKKNYPDIHKEKPSLLGEMGKGFQREAKYGGLIGGAVGAAAGAASYGMEKLEKTVGKGYEEIAKVSGASPEAASTIGKVASIAPDLVLGGATGRQIGEKAIGPLAKHFMEQAVSPKRAGMTIQMAENISKTALDNGITVSKGGASKLDKMLEGLDSQAKELIARSTVKVPAKEIMGELKSPEAKREFTKLYREFKGGDIPIQRLQDFKQLLGRRISQYQRMPLKEAGTSELTEGRIELEKALRKRIAAGEPGISPHNEKMHELLQLKPFIHRRVLGEAEKMIKPRQLKSYASTSLERGARAIGGGVGAGVGAEVGQQSLGEP